MRLALDTNRYRDFADGDPPVIQALELADVVFVPFVVLAELRAGFAVGTKTRQNERTLQRFLMVPGISICYADDGTTRLYASIFAQLRAQGTPIPTNDLWIAALALQHNLTLFRRDHHFDQIPQLIRF